MGETTGNLNRMLNLITSQVTYRRQLPVFGPQTHTSVKPSDLSEQHFKVENKNCEWIKYSQSTFSVTLDDVKNGCMIDSPTYVPLLYKLHDHMDHNTPNPSDKVVYTTVDEAHSSSIDDIGKFLTKLKAELRIGEPGFPEYIILGGDQQTYAHVKNLICR